ncbi:CFAI factor, partial [Formicarius rufipectus]|nr:CFAI factor [Formicarius rufipectus]
ECLSNQYTHKSCKKVFCHPWERCVEGKCLCKLPYQCPKNGSSVCSTNGKNFRTYCQLKSYECQQPKAKFLHKGKCMPAETFSVSLDHADSSLLQVKPVNQMENSFVCASEWTMNEANVACKDLGFELGAEYYQAVSSITESALNSLHCLQITCRGLETSLAECHIEMKPRDSNEGLVSLQCHENLRACSGGEFSCVNKKCISLNKTCDGINDCGDLSDELCCRECRDNSFHCRSNICIPNKNVCNKEIDCLTGEDEARVLCAGTFFLFVKERKMIKTLLSQVHCGVKNHTLTRRKRIVGGEIAKKGEFPWQVAIKDTSNEGTTVYCGGVYIGGCWVLTAAHCVRASRVHLYRVWVGMLNSIQYDKETHTLGLKQLIIHENYNASTYENDIALLELSGSGNGECSADHNSIPACIPWSEYMFKAGDTCKVSGWGLEKGYTKQFILKWGNVNLFQNCSELYPGRFFKKMACAGKHQFSYYNLCTYDGSTDSCKGDSGGPLVCFDAENVAYVWGIVSWGENCGEAGHPGVYTNVASYYDWISHHVTRSLIARYNI